MGNKRCVYRLSPLAEADLEGIWLYTFRQWSLEQADDYHRVIMAAIHERMDADRHLENQDEFDGNRISRNAIPEGAPCALSDEQASFLRWEWAFVIHDRQNAAWCSITAY